MSDTDAPNDGEIEMVMTVIRPDKLSDTKTALAEIGALSLTVTNVSGRGSQLVKRSRRRGEKRTVNLRQKVRIEYVVTGVPADDVVDAIADAAQTGEKGDEKVFTLPTESAMQVRVGKTGRDVV